jgi:hypothetical protein
MKTILTESKLRDIVKEAIKKQLFEIETINKKRPESFYGLKKNKYYKEPFKKKRNKEPYNPLDWEVNPHDKYEQYWHLYNPFDDLNPKEVEEAKELYYDYYFGGKRPNQDDELSPKEMEKAKELYRREYLYTRLKPEDINSLYNKTNIPLEWLTNKTLDKMAHGDELTFSKPQFDKRGFEKTYGYHKDTGKKYNPEGFYRDGYNKEGYDENGYDRNGYDINGNKRKRVKRNKRDEFNRELYNNSAKRQAIDDMQRDGIDIANSAFDYLK